MSKCKSNSDKGATSFLLFMQQNAKDWTTDRPMCIVTGGCDVNECSLDKYLGLSARKFALDDRHV